MELGLRSKRKNSHNNNKEGVGGWGERQETEIVLLNARNMFPELFQDFRQGTEIHDKTLKKCLSPPRSLSPRKDGPHYRRAAVKSVIFCILNARANRSCFPENMNASLPASTTPGTTRARVSGGAVCLPYRE